MSWSKSVVVRVFADRVVDFWPFTSVVMFVVFVGIDDSVCSNTNQIELEREKMIQ